MMKRATLVSGQKKKKIKDRDNNLLPSDNKKVHMESADSFVDGEVTRTLCRGGDISDK